MSEQGMRLVYRVELTQQERDHVLICVGKQLAALHDLEQFTTLNAVFVIAIVESARDKLAAAVPVGGEQSLVAALRGDDGGSDV